MVFIPHTSLMNPFSALSHALPTPLAASVSHGSENPIIPAQSIIDAVLGGISILVSKPVVEIRASSVVVYLHYYSLVPSTMISANTVSLLGDVLSSHYGKPVEVYTVRLQYPYSDAYILAQYLSLELSVVKFRDVATALSTCIPLCTPTGHVSLDGRSRILGVHVRTGGRLPHDALGPLVTSQELKMGSLTRGAQNVRTTASYTTTNQLGAYTVTVTLVQEL